MLAFGVSLLVSGIGSVLFHLPYGWQIDATNSMEPLIYPGDVVLVLPQIGRASIGEILVYYQPQEGIYYAHEVIGYKDGGYITKGINNPYPDPWIVKESWVRGFIPTVFGYPIKIPEVGYTVKLIETTLGEKGLILLVAGAAVFSEVRSRLLGGEVKIRRPRQLSKRQLLGGFFLVAFAVSMVALSHGVIRVEGEWNVVHFQSLRGYTNVGLSFSLGTLRTNSTYYFGGNVSSKVPALFVFLSSNPDVRFLNDPLVDMGGKATENFTVTTGGVGEQGSVVTEMAVPYVLPAGAALYVAKVNPIFLLALVSSEVSFFITLVVWGVMELTSRRNIEPAVRS
ncbi:S26 family signal peptidase [Sulfodiicoccus acidiphilus]|uniref:S26 family signal peptidase n=2 Tax=Sulfodiicoccus acidiphilus TaxID=1670455 RepID=A0A348B1Z9_9CREN|nr:S26 family signal peptidase [Sulfodiicoccus acidiphilus]GGU03087.1 S26 family signal peptidase [Sulfodiicoccus acidiphilus]